MNILEVPKVLQVSVTGSIQCVLLPEVGVCKPYS